MEVDTVNPYAPVRSDDDTADAWHEDSEYALARVGTRFWANLIDTALAVGAAFCGAALGFMVDSTSGLYERTRDGIEWTTAGVFAILALIAFQIVQAIFIAGTGQSLGKRWLRIQIVRLNGTHAGFLRGVVLRSWIPALVGFVPIIGRFFGLIDVALIGNSERRCVHDYLAGTIVVLAQGE